MNLTIGLVKLSCWLIDSTFINIFSNFLLCFDLCVLKYTHTLRFRGFYSISWRILCITHLPGSVDRKPQLSIMLILDSMVSKICLLFISISLVQKLDNFMKLSSRNLGGDVTTVTNQKNYTPFQNGYINVS